MKVGDLVLAPFGNAFDIVRIILLNRETNGRVVVGVYSGGIELRLKSRLKLFSSCTKEEIELYCMLYPQWAEEIKEQTHYD